MKLILASTSQYRSSLLAKLGLPFENKAPNVNETPKPNESAESLVKRLAMEKAYSVAKVVNEGLVIGSDQVACIDQVILGKPGTFEKAKQQLTLCSGKTVRFYTGICLHNAQSNRSQVEVDVFDVSFRYLNERQIDGYLNKEQPFDCAGSFKSEGLGICLFEKLSGNDPNALIGLPLITLIKMLQHESVDPLV